ncbi:cytochrome C oxidase subunit II [Paenibacillus darwinianus]|uniref:Cytochrome C oxidase subunit II n=1 Tax=Paenibacillus darwinianus TaxID=1380763 RepID=A0A9W5S3I0_9BACL|nr:cytochrome c oxidase subunit II [Paenibacillus darwinianus]EXX89438.1 cytochrome C oxidase subunit II [Paenibacillus darwinianus]EXX90788.1 cytochrome C oxidase subunit II [Paenibacillus darwinianus]EXX90838.1 cytochrome C oxidase subunit II [Paenibacillus darwinianus]
MHKWMMFVVFIAASVLGLYLITFGLPAKQMEEAPSLPEGMTLLQVEASNDFVFDQPEYRVKQGEMVRLVLKNKTGIHGLGIADLGVDLQGDKLEQDITFDKAGEYEVVCTVPCGVGHANMKSKLIVEK